MGLEELEKKLYKRDFNESGEQSEKFLKEKTPQQEQEYKSGWTGNSNLKSRLTFDFSKIGKIKEPFLKISRFGRWIFLGAMIILIGASAATGFYLYQYFSSDREISLNVFSENSVLAGVPFNLAVNFGNGSKNVLKGAALSVFLPENAVVLGMEKNKRVFTKEIGDLEPGESFQEKIQILIFGNEKAVKKFNVSVSYSSSLSSRFEKNQNLEIAIRESGIKLDIIAPEKVLNNEEFETTVNYSNVSEYDFSNVKLSLIYPKNFILKDAEPEITGNILEIGSLPKGREGTILIIGKITGPEKSFFEINSKVEASYKGENYIIGEKTAKLNIASSPLSFKIESNFPEGYVFPGNTVKYKLSYFNSSDVGLGDAVVKIWLKGEMFDFFSLRTNGFFDSRDNTVTWNAASAPQLRLIESGSGGSVEFEIQIKSNYPIKKLSDKNFVLKARAEISSPTVPYYVAADKTIGLAEWGAKVGGGLIIEQTAYFKDPSAFVWGISNKGSLPPKANQPVNFTVHWVIRNFATDVKNVNIKAYLNTGIKFTGAVKSNINSVPVYNERTQEIVWSIDKIAATKGIISKPIEAVFQVEAVPSIIQIGREMAIISETPIMGIDEFVNVILNSAAKALTTRDLNDIGFVSKNGEVVQ